MTINEQNGADLSAPDEKSSENEELVNTGALWFLLVLLIIVAGSIWLAFVGDQIEIL